MPNWDRRKASSSASAEAFSVLVGDAAVVQAGSAEVPAFHEGHGHPGAGGGKGGRVPAGASPMTVRRMGMARLLVLVAFEIQIVFHREGRFEASP